MIAKYDTHNRVCFTDGQYKTLGLDLIIKFSNKFNTLEKKPTRSYWLHVCGKLTGVGGWCAHYSF